MPTVHIEGVPQALVFPEGTDRAVIDRVVKDTLAKRDTAETADANQVQANIESYQQEKAARAKPSLWDRFVETGAVLSEAGEPGAPQSTEGIDLPRLDWKETASATGLSQDSAIKLTAVLNRFTSPVAEFAVSPKGAALAIPGVGAIAAPLFTIDAVRTALKTKAGKALGEAYVAANQPNATPEAKQEFWNQVADMGALTVQAAAGAAPGARMLARRAGAMPALASAADVAKAGAPATAAAVASAATDVPKAKVEAPAPSAPVPAPIDAAPPKPAIKTPAGDVVTGSDHVSAYANAKEGIAPDTSGSREGFVNAQGQFLSREEASSATGLPTKVEEGKLHSSDLPQPEPIAKAPKPAKGSTEIEAAVIPGARQFIENDVVPFAKEAADAISGTAADMESLLSAPTKSPPAALAAGVVREHAAKLAQRDVQMRALFDTTRKKFDALPDPANLTITDAIERGAPQATPELQAFADNARRELDTRTAEIQGLGTGKLQRAIEDYFPHLWQDPAKAGPWYAGLLGKRPLRGSGSFLKRRSIPTTADGIAKGLVPVTYNPAELLLLKLHEMDRYIMGQRVFNEYRDKGLVEFSRSDIPPAGKARIDDRIGNVIEYRPTVTKGGKPGAPERVLRGHWFAQEDAARVLNNYLSPGLRNYQWFRATRWIGNTMNMAQLGLSGFHFTFTMLDATTAKLALGLRQASRGELRSLPTLARGVAGLPGINQLEYYLRGSKVLHEYTKPGSVGGDYAKIVDSLLASGGRIEMPRIFNNTALEGFFKAMRQGNYPGALARLPFATIEAISYPLMQHLVPRLKLGVFSDMALDDVRGLPSSASRDQVRAKLGKVWDSVDNRLGEMVYDNLFWHSTLKDLSFLAVRAVGWNLGTLRELGGGVLDTATLVKRLRQGDQAVTHRMAYTMALPITVGLAGALYQYLKTGQGPQELRDYFYPKTGKLLPDGTQERVNFPSYMKDIESVRRHPLKTVMDKLHPMWSTIYDMLENQDYYGTQIRNENDPLVRQLGQEAAFVANSFVPISVRTAGKRPDAKAESFFGVMPIKPELARTPAQNKIVDYVRNHSPIGGRTQEEHDRGELAKEIEGMMTRPDEYGTAKDALRSAQREGKLTKGQRAYQESRLRFERRAMTQGATKGEAAWSWRFRHLSLDEAQHVYELATPHEKTLFGPELRRKLRAAHQTMPSEQPQE